MQKLIASADSGAQHQQQTSSSNPSALSPTLLPNVLARLVSALSRSSTISLRLGTYVAETVLHSARLTTITSIDVSRRAVESLVFKAEEDVPESETFTGMGMNAIIKTSTLAQLFASASFHLASTAVTTFSNLAQDSVHMIDSIFGSTESSRAIASIISLIRRELGDGAGLYGLVSGLTCFSILQIRGLRRTMMDIEMRVLWDVVVLDTGETRTLEVKNPRTDLYDGLQFIQHISADSEVVVSTEEVTTRTTTIEVIGGNSSDTRVVIPDNAMLIHEEQADIREGDKSRYRVMFQSVSKHSNKKRGHGNEFTAIHDTPKHANTPRIPNTKKLSIQEPDEQRLVELNDDNTAYGMDIFDPVSTNNQQSLVLDDSDFMTADSVISSPEFDDTIAPDSPISVSRRVSKSVISYDSKRNGSHQSSPFSTREQNEARKRLSRHNSAPNGVTNARRQMSNGKTFAISPSESVSNSQPQSPSANRTAMGRRRASSTSMYTFKSTQSQTSLVLDATEEEQIQSFPPGHICHNMARYMRFASASYGQSFLRLLGLGLTDKMFPTNDDHHSEHHAFADHAGIGLEHILLSSFSDSTVDQSGGIPLVHFVAVDHVNKTVVLTIRGTMGLEDVLTDMTCEYGDFEWSGRTYKAHTGMLKSALLLCRQSSRVLMTIQVALKDLGPSYGLVMCGHSMGGGVCALLSILLSEPGPNNTFVTAKDSGLPAGRNVHCYAFGPTATVSADLRRVTRGLITSVVYGNDIVPCLSLGVLRDFQNVALAFKADHRIVDELKKRVFSKLASRTAALFDTQDDDYLWKELCKLRANMNSEKLVPPGEVYHLTTSTVFETHDGRTKKATRVVGRVIFDVENRFREPVFGRGIFHHSPVYYERALDVLERGICEDNNAESMI
ncbi:uncharacterized protein V1516DRAFT_691056 [Lipomyces oligophaga]|uniref:uncharacterized protein n=1 Tax=Lipomyces oligophaga TaxID=45792 RepID=UPI0034CFB3BD